MKTALNIKISSHTNSIIEREVAETGATKTAIVERAIDNTFSQQAKFLREALHTIEEAKVNRSSLITYLLEGDVFGTPNWDGKDKEQIKAEKAARLWLKGKYEPAIIQKGDSVEFRHQGTTLWVKNERNGDKAFLPVQNIVCVEVLKV